MQYHRTTPKGAAARKAGARQNLLFAAAVLALALALLAFGAWRRAQARGEALVGVLTYRQTSGHSLAIIPLDEDATHDFEAAGYTIHIQVQQGEAAFVNSPCPDHLCESFGWLGEQNAWAACMPADAFLRITTLAEAEAEAEAMELD